MLSKLSNFDQFLPTILPSTLNHSLVYDLVPVGLDLAFRDILKLLFARTEKIRIFCE